MAFPAHTVTVCVRGFRVRGELVDTAPIDHDNNLAWYYFPNDAVLGDAFETQISPWEARDRKAIRTVARENYRGLARD